MVYSGAVINVTVIGIVWIQHQLKPFCKAVQEMEEVCTILRETGSGSWSDGSRFRCFFAAQLYQALNARRSDEETEAEMFEVLQQCRGYMYRKLPIETPAVRPQYLPPQF